MAGWQHAFGDLTPTAEVALTGGDPFVVFGAPIAEDALVVAAGIGVDVSDHAQLGLPADMATTTASRRSVPC